MAVDWLAIRNDYINGGGSYRKLAEKYGIPFSKLKDVAVRDKWKNAREQQANATRTEVEQRTREKIADALSEEAAVKARIRLKLIRMAEDWVDKQEGSVNDPADYRRIVQSCMDMGVFEPDAVNAGETREDDPLTKSLLEEAERLDNADIE